MSKKNRVDHRSEEVWKARLDELREKALKGWRPVEQSAFGGPILPTLVHDWKVSLSVGGSEKPGQDIWIFSARWPSGEPSVEELVWARQAVAYLGAPEDVKENSPSPTTGARYWIWRKERQA